MCSVDKDLSVCSDEYGDLHQPVWLFGVVELGILQKRMQLGQGLAFSDESLQEFYLVGIPMGHVIRDNPGSIEPEELRLRIGSRELNQR